MPKSFLHDSLVALLEFRIFKALLGLKSATFTHAVRYGENASYYASRNIHTYSFKIYIKKKKNYKVESYELDSAKLWWKIFQIFHT